MTLAEAITEALDFLDNGTPIYPGSLLHGEMREALNAADARALRRAEIKASIQNGSYEQGDQFTAKVAATADRLSQVICEGRR